VILVVKCDQAKKPIIDAQLIARVLLLDYEPAASVLRTKQDPSAPAAIVTPELRKDLRRTAAQWLTP
jgi:hypothetical protein